ncbi:MAG: Inner membrane protein [Candidatus Anoxychlamydiales bacterium]|nr:Inner membrane protein [Candidatus Anoxychlamydiales bacterium]
MSYIINFIFENANHAHWIIFSALILAGFNLPISEDLMIIISAILAANVVPQNIFLLFGAVFLGAYMSDWIVYWIGRLFGIKLWKFKWFKKTIPKRKLAKVKLFYKKYGFFTLLVGRFIPFGVRNCLFLTAGMTRMNFTKFAISDGIACLISNSVLFSIAYSLGKNHTALFTYLKKVNILIFLLFIFTIIGFIWYYKKKKHKQKT